MWYAPGLMIIIFFYLFLSLRAKLFRGKKVQGEYDIRVEQVRYFTMITGESEDKILLICCYVTVSYLTSFHINCHCEEHFFSFFNFTPPCDA